MYERQESIGWRNFLKGRLTRGWAITKHPSEGRISQQEWLRHLIQTVLKDLHICNIIAEAKNTKEKEDLLAEARSLWATTTASSFLTQDSYLADDEYEPQDTWTPTRQRNWLLTKRLAIDTATELATTRQTLITT